MSQIVNSRKPATYKKNFICGLEGSPNLRKRN